MNQLYLGIMAALNEKTSATFQSQFVNSNEISEKIFIIPPKRVRYLSEIAENNRSYDTWVKEQAELATLLYQLEGVAKIEGLDWATDFNTKKEVLQQNLSYENKTLLDNWEAKKQAYQNDEFIYKVRDKEIKVATKTVSLSHSKIPKISLPRYKDWGQSEPINAFII